MWQTDDSSTCCEHLHLDHRNLPRILAPTSMSLLASRIGNKCMTILDTLLCTQFVIKSSHLTDLSMRSCLAFQVRIPAPWPRPTLRLWGMKLIGSSFWFVPRTLVQGSPPLHTSWKSMIDRIFKRRLVMSAGPASQTPGPEWTISKRSMGFLWPC